MYVREERDNHNSPKDKSKHRSTRFKTKKCHFPPFNQIKGIHISNKSLLITIFVTIIIAFVLGCITRLCIIFKCTTSSLEKISYGRTLSFMVDENAQLNKVQKHANDIWTEMTNPSLPSPKLIKGKKMPHSTYTSKVFHVQSADTSNTVFLDTHSLDQNIKPMTMKRSNTVTSMIHADRDDPRSSNLRPMARKRHEADTDIREDVHLPTGQHLVSCCM